MKKIIFFVCVLGFGFLSAQELHLTKGKVVDGLKVSDSLPDTYSLYLPSKFTTEKEWPLLFVFDMDGKSKRAIRYISSVAENEGYVLVAPNSLHDSISVAKNVNVLGKTYNAITDILPIQKNRIYTIGFSKGGQFASVVPVLVSGVAGAISCGAPLISADAINFKKPFYYIGIVGKGDFNYHEMDANYKFLKRIKFPNDFLFFDGKHQWPPQEMLGRALQMFTLSAMAKGITEKDEDYIDSVFGNLTRDIEKLITEKKLNKADKLLSEVMGIFRLHKDVTPLKEKRKLLRKEKIYKSLKRAEVNAIFKERLLREDYDFYIEEDTYTYNFNNLGWWAHQVSEIEKFIKSPNNTQMHMGQRLKGYLTALVEDNLDMVFAEPQLDNGALSFLWMLKTIVDPKDYDTYLKLISHSARGEDFGTAIFYLEELLKNDYTDYEKLYQLEYTALLKISPEFNKTIYKYLGKAKYLFDED